MVEGAVVETALSSDSHRNRLQFDGLKKAAALQRPCVSPYMVLAIVYDRGTIYHPWNTCSGHA